MTTAAPRRGLFLDLDGTLADTLPALRGVYRAFLRRFGCEGTDAEFETINGPPLDIVIARLIANHGLAGNAADLLTQYRSLVTEAHGQATPMAGARAVLERAQARGWIATVVTSATQAETHAWLARTGLDGLIAVVIGGDAVARGKPDPAPYLAALQHTGCRAEDSLAVEDSVQGAHAALAAGLPTWILGNTADRDLAEAKLFRGCLADLNALAAKL